MIFCNNNRFKIHCVNEKRKNISYLAHCTSIAHPCTHNAKKILFYYQEFSLKSYHVLPKEISSTIMNIFLYNHNCEMTVYIIFSAWCPVIFRQKVYLLIEYYKSLSDRN